MITIYNDVIGNSLSEHYTDNQKAMSSQELGQQMSRLNMSTAIMPDSRKGVKDQLLQRHIHGGVILMLLSQIVKAEHKEALRLTVVHPESEIDLPLILMMTTRPADMWLNRHRRKTAGKSIPHSRQENKESEKTKRAEPPLGPPFLKATNQKKWL